MRPLWVGSAVFSFGAFIAFLERGQRFEATIWLVFSSVYAGVAARRNL